MWVCIYAVLVTLITVIISILLMQESRRRQRRLTADLAHELRTPLACLQGGIEALIDGVWEPTPERLESCNEEIQRLTKLVTDLSLLTDLEWEYVKLNKTDFDIATLLEVTAAQFQAEAAQKGISLILDAESRITHADYDRLKQVFVNIISNALKNTDEGSVTLRNRGREITVKDTGRGIAPRDLSRIFERFYRADASRNRQTGASGVGLTIARALVRAHGGDVTAESELGKGSVFRIFL
jgi:signal transduction histidine kinase